MIVFDKNTIILHLIIIFDTICLLHRRPRRDCFAIRVPYRIVEYRPSSSSRKSHFHRIFPLAVVVVIFRGEKPSETMIPRRLLIVAFVSSTRIEWWCYFRRRRVPSCCFCRRRRRVAIV